MRLLDHVCDPTLGYTYRFAFFLSSVFRPFFSQSQLGADSSTILELFRAKSSISMGCVAAEAIPNCKAKAYSGEGHYSTVLKLRRNH